MTTLERQQVKSFGVRRYTGVESHSDIDAVAVEEPLSIRVQHWFKDAALTETLALTMRTPGHDRELAAGLLLVEGVVRSVHDIVDIRPLGGAESNEILVELARGVDFESWRLARSAVMNSSCGICGKRSIESLSTPLGSDPPFADPSRGFTVPASLLERLPDALRAEQAGFAATGGLHAAALLDETGVLLRSFEDIGRHNALDKLLGWSLLKEQVPLSRRILLLSSRSSFELIQKAAAGGAPLLATVGAPSSLAIETAERYGLTLVGFLRGRRFNVYSGAWRVNSGG